MLGLARAQSNFLSPSVTSGGRTTEPCCRVRGSASRLLPRTDRAHHQRLPAVGAMLTLARSYAESRRWKNER